MTASPPATEPLLRIDDDPQTAAALNFSLPRALEAITRQTSHSCPHAVQRSRHLRRHGNFRADLKRQNPGSTGGTASGAPRPITARLPLARSRNVS